MADDLNVNVTESIYLQEHRTEPQKKPFEIEFNALGLLMVNPETGEIKVLRHQFVHEDKRVTRIVLWPGGTSEARYIIRAGE